MQPSFFLNGLAKSSKSFLTTNPVCIAVVSIATCILLHLNVGYTSAVIPFAVTAITIVNPITTCYFVLPYRRAISSVFSRAKISGADVNVSSVYNHTTKVTP